MALSLDTNDKEERNDIIVSRRDVGNIAAAATAIAATGVLSNTLPVNAAEEEEGKLIEFLIKNVDGDPGNEGRILIRTHPSWAPNGVTRFEKLTQVGFWDDCRIFRVLPGFIVSLR